MRGLPYDGTPTEIAGALVVERDEPDGTVTLRWGPTGLLVRAGLSFEEAEALAGEMRRDIARAIRGALRAARFDAAHPPARGGAR